MINFDKVKKGDKLICIKDLMDIPIVFIKNKEYLVKYITSTIDDDRPYGIIISDDINNRCRFYNTIITEELYFYDEYFIDKNSYRKEKLKKLTESK